LIFAAHQLISFWSVASHCQKTGDVSKGELYSIIAEFEVSPGRREQADIVLLLHKYFVAIPIPCLLLSVFCISLFVPSYSWLSRRNCLYLSHCWFMEIMYRLSLLIMDLSEYK
jgi:hypothetical protein